MPGISGKGGNVGFVRVGTSANGGKVAFGSVGISGGDSSRRRAALQELVRKKKPRRMLIVKNVEVEAMVFNEYVSDEGKRLILCYL